MGRTPFVTDHQRDKIKPMKIHLIAIGGTGMAPLACLLKEAGHEIRGSDGPLYPPTSDLSREMGIEPWVGYQPSHLDWKPDLVVVGNAVPRSNVESEEAERQKLTLLSMPQALHRFFLSDRRPLVVSGTHGKTTTSSMAAWVWTYCKRDPSYLLGGVPRDLPSSFALARGDRFIIEGDEYNAAWFDRGPKFLHYAAECLILTSAEYDHVDLYPSHEVFLAAFEALVQQVEGRGGTLVACIDDPWVRALAESFSGNLLTYALEREADYRPRNILWLPEGTRCELPDPQGQWHPFYLPAPGPHSLSNATAVWVAALVDGLEPGNVAEAFARFKGVKRRLEEVGESGGVLVVDDFAHHPSAVKVTLRGVAQKWPNRRRVVVFEPRSLSAGQGMFKDAFQDAMLEADVVVLAPVFHRERLGEKALDRHQLAQDLSDHGKEAWAPDDFNHVLKTLQQILEPNDVVVTMSSGSFGGLPRKILDLME